MCWILNVKLNDQQFEKCHSDVRSWIISTGRHKEVAFHLDPHDNSFSLTADRAKLVGLAEWIVTESEWDSAEITLIPKRTN